MILYNASSSYYSMIARYALLEAGIPFDNRRMDIHLAKEQLTPWYMKINPAMTVPSLVDNDRVWTDSRDILKYAAETAGELWSDSNSADAQTIEALVQAHYAISIERLTFGKAMSTIPPLKFLALRMLRNAVKDLKAQLARSDNPSATQAKINLNEERLAYFTQGNLADKLEQERLSVRNFIEKLPRPETFLFGDKPSSVDIVTVVLLGRLSMIGEYGLVKSPDLQDWFKRMQMRDNYKKADIWTYFQPWRILFKR